MLFTTLPTRVWPNLRSWGPSQTYDRGLSNCFLYAQIFYVSITSLKCEYICTGSLGNHFFYIHINIIVFKKQNKNY